MAAETTVIDYDAEDLEPPILSIEQSVERSSFFDIPSILYPSEVGDFAKGMAEADDQSYFAEIRLTSQHCFYMESQSALAIPDEDNYMVVYSSIQAPAYAQSVIAGCLNISEHNVRVITMRVRGGFGGKVIKAMSPIISQLIYSNKSVLRGVSILILKLIVRFRVANLG